MRDSININKAVDIFTSEINVGEYSDTIKKFIDDAIIANDLNGVMLIEGEPIEFIHKGVAINIMWDMLSIVDSNNNYGDLTTPKTMARIINKVD